MLFLLTGDTQIGKSRWLSNFVSELSSRGVLTYGVLAPGVWVESSGSHANASGFEKLGIDNVLLPGGERLRFADRLDLAKEHGTFSREDQSARAGLGWHITDEALERVNEHLTCIATCSIQDAGSGLLVIDEIGRLELHRGEGLVQAMRLLEAGPKPAFENALVVVRDTLASEVEDRFSQTWGGMTRISPTEDGRDTICSALTRNEE